MEKGQNRDKKWIKSAKGNYFKLNLLLGLKVFYSLEETLHNREWEFSNQNQN